MSGIRDIVYGWNGVCPIASLPPASGSVYRVVLAVMSGEILTLPVSIVLVDRANAQRSWGSWYGRRWTIVDSVDARVGATVLCGSDYDAVEDRYVLRPPTEEETAIMYAAVFGRWPYADIYIYTLEKP